MVSNNHSECQSCIALTKWNTLIAFDNSIFRRAHTHKLFIKENEIMRTYKNIIYLEKN